MGRFLVSISIFAVLLAPGLAGAGEPASSSWTGPSEPSAVGKISASIKSGFSKLTGALTPQMTTEQAPDPISLSVPARPSPELHLSVGKMADEGGNSEKAEHHYQEALKLDGKHFETLIAYAHLLDRQEKLEEAMELYRRAVLAKPTSAVAHNDLGICYARRGMLPEALESLGKAIQLQPKQPLYRNNAATVLVEMKRVDEAFSHLRAVHPEAIACYNMGYLLHKAGDTQTAARMFAEAAAKDPSLKEARAWAERLRTADGQRRDSAARIARRPADPPLAVPPPGSSAPMPPSVGVSAGGGNPALLGISPRTGAVAAPPLQPLPPAGASYRR